MFSPTVQKLIDELSKLPGVGPKTAQRLAFHLLKLSSEEALPLAQALIDVKETVHFCSRCFNLTEEELCPICLDARRDQSTICVVEEPGDVISVERTHEYSSITSWAEPFLPWMGSAHRSSSWPSCSNGYAPRK
jgi:recombination protein RecR